MAVFENNLQAWREATLCLTLNIPLERSVLLTRLRTSGFAIMTQELLRSIWNNIGVPAHWKSSFGPKVLISGSAVSILFIAIPHIPRYM